MSHRLSHETDDDDDDYFDEYGDDIDVDSDDYDFETRRRPGQRRKLATSVSHNGTWCSGECLREVHDQLLPHESAVVDRRSYRKVIDVRPYMRGYWVGGLQSGNRYEFCIGLLRLDDLDEQLLVVSGSRPSTTVQLINCSTVVTSATSRLGGHHRGRHQPLVDDLDGGDMLVVFVTSGVFAAVCFVPGSIGLIGAMIRRRRRRKQYVEPQQQQQIGIGRQSAAAYLCDAGNYPEFRIADVDLDPVTMTFDLDSPLSIPLDNLYQLNTAHVLSSRTAALVS